MSLSDVVIYLAAWGIIGATLFSVFVIIVFRSGIVYAARKEDGLIKERIPLTGYLPSAGFLVLIVIFLLAANYFGVIRRSFQPGFWGLFGLNYGLYLVLFLFDSLVIDGLVLGRWRPGFLNLPDAMGSESMREHIKKSLPVGIVFGLILALLSSTATYYLFL